MKKKVKLNKNKVKFHSYTAKDFEFDFFAGATNGGQNANRNNNCCRCRHIPSGAIGVSKDERYQSVNKELAFRRCAESKEFQAWMKVDSSIRLGNPSPEILAEKNVNEVMEKLEDFKIEIQVGKNQWKEISLEDFLSMPENENYICQNYQKL